MWEHWREVFDIRHCNHCHKTVCFWIVKDERFMFCSGNRFEKRGGCGHRMDVPAGRAASQTGAVNVKHGRSDQHE